MEIFRDLRVTATAERMAAVVEEIDKAKPAGWTRNKAAEGRWTPPLVMYCFECKKEGWRSAAMIILMEKAPGTFHVANIIPTEAHQLTHAGYNAVLEDFYERALKPYADRFGLECSFTGAEVGLEYWMSPETAGLLREFSSLANKGTGSSLPADRERWNAFVLSSHRTESKLDPSTLQRWLVEVDGWAPEIAEQLAIEYNYGLELLGYALPVSHQVA